MNEQREAELFAIVNFIKDKALTKDEALKMFATKDDLKAFATKDDLRMMHDEIIARCVTKDEMQKIKNEIINHIDGFAQNQTKFDQELVATRSRFERLEDRVDKVEEKVGI